MAGLHNHGSTATSLQPPQNSGSWGYQGALQFNQHAHSQQVIFYPGYYRDSTSAASVQPNRGHNYYRQWQEPHTTSTQWQGDTDKKSAENQMPNSTAGPSNPETSATLQTGLNAPMNGDEAQARQLTNCEA
jgi:hypothetical protein